MSERTDTETLAKAVDKIAEILGSLRMRGSSNSKIDDDDIIALCVSALRLRELQGERDNLVEALTDSVRLFSQQQHIHSRTYVNWERQGMAQAWDGVLKNLESGEYKTKEKQ